MGSVWWVRPGRDTGEVLRRRTRSVCNRPGQNGDPCINTKDSRVFTQVKSSQTRYTSLGTHITGGNRTRIAPNAWVSYNRKYCVDDRPALLPRTPCAHQPIGCPGCVRSDGACPQGTVASGKASNWGAIGKSALRKVSRREFPDTGQGSPESRPLRHSQAQVCPALTLHEANQEAHPWPVRGTCSNPGAW